jgi:hypothetical protein
MVVLQDDTVSSEAFNESAPYGRSPETHQAQKPDAQASSLAQQLDQLANRLSRVEQLLQGTGRADGGSTAPRSETLDIPLGSNGPSVTAGAQGAVSPLALGGEESWLSALLFPASPLQPALARSEQQDVTGAGHWMSTSATLNKDGTLHATTRTWSENWVLGFTGGAFVVLGDSAGNKLGYTDVHSFGVDAKGIFWKAHDRLDAWTHFFGTDVANAATGLYVYHAHTPHPRLPEIIQEILDTARTIEEGYQRLKQIFPILP